MQGSDDAGVPVDRTSPALEEAATLSREGAVDRLLLDSALMRAEDVVLITAAALDAPGPEIVHVSDGFTRMTGYTAAEVIGRSPRFLQGPGTDEGAKARIRAALQHGEAVREELLNYRKDGSPFWVELSIVPITDGHGRITHWASNQRETTGRRLLEDEIRESHDVLHAMIQVFPLAVVTLDGDGAVESWNPAAERIFGWRSDEVVGRASPHILPQKRRGFRAMCEAAGRGDAVIGTETTCRDKAGNPVDVRLSMSCLPRRGASGVMLVCEDVTMRRRMEGEFLQLSRRMELILDSAEEGIYGLDAERRTTFVNAAAERLLGWSAEELVGQVQHDFIHHSRPDGSPHSIEDCPVYATLRDGRVHASGNDIFWRKDGTGVEVEYTSVPIKEGQRITGAVVTFRDVTERRRSEEALRQSEARFRMLVDTASEGVSTLDSEGRTNYVNQRMADMLGYEPSEMIGRSLHDFHDDDAAEEGTALMQRHRQDLANVREVRFRRKDGADLWALLSTTPIPGLSRSPGGVLTMATDITDRKRAEAELIRAKESAERAAQVKSEFLANMSHEIRTPMNGIIGMTGLLLDTDLTGEQRDYLEMVDESAESLLRVLNDILDLSRVESGSLELDPQPFPLRETLVDTLNTLGLRARQKGLGLSFRVRPEVPNGVIGDAGRIRQVLVNLVGNAIKFTDAGEVSVNVGREAGEGGEMMLHVTVQDDGIGIAPERQAAVFDRFTQADSSTTRRFGGSGLGLAISSQLVGLMGGRIWVESEPGRGSAFHFTARLDLGPAGASLARDDVGAAPRAIPRAGAGASRSEWVTGTHNRRPAMDRSVRTPEGADTDETARPGGLHVLVAEDNPVNQRLALALLRKSGHRVTLAENGLAAVEAFEREPFDLVLMDLQMPVLGGLDATARIRQSEQLSGGHVPIIALTARAMAGDRERCLEAGMDGYLSKPLNPEQLLTAIAALVFSGDRNAAATPEAGGHHKGNNKLSAEVDADSLAAAGLDRTQLLVSLVGDEDLLRELVDIFLTDTPKLRADIRSAMERGDSLTLADTAHRLKGSVGVFQAHRALAAVQALEGLATRGELQEAARYLPEFEACLDLLEEALSGLRPDTSPK